MCSTDTNFSICFAFFFLFCFILQAQFSISRKWPRRIICTSFYKRKKLCLTTVGRNYGEEINQCLNVLWKWMGTPILQWVTQDPRKCVLWFVELTWFEGLPNKCSNWFSKLFGQTRRSQCSGTALSKCKLMVDFFL